MTTLQKTKTSPTKFTDGDILTLLGNEAAAYGLLDEGVQFAASYPGTPSTEVMDMILKLQKTNDMIASWSTNEAVAFEEAAAVAITGKNSAFVCK